MADGETRMMSTKNQSAFFGPVVIAAAVVVIVFGIKASVSFSSSIIFALFLTALIYPTLKKLQATGLSKELALVNVCSLIVLSICILIGIISVSVTEFSAKIPYYQEQLAATLQPLVDYLNSKGANLNSLIPNNWLSGEALIDSILWLVSSLISGGVNLVFFLMTWILMMIAADTFVAKFQKYYPKATSASGDLATWIKDVQNQFGIQTLNNLFVATGLGIAYSIIGIDFAILWAILTFILAYIPNIGITLAAIPPAILALIQFGWPTAALTITCVVLLNFFMDNVVTPKMIGDGVKTPPVIVFVSFLFWSWILGPLGAFLAVPFTLGIRAILSKSESTKFGAYLLTSEDKDKFGSSN